MSIEYASNQAYVDGSNNSAVTRMLWGVAIVWFAVDASLGASGFFSEHRQFIFLFVLTPMIVFAVAFAALPGLRAWAFALDTRALVFAQAARTGGAAFLSAYAIGKLNGAFALWAGLIDVAVGLSAPFAAQYLTPTQTVKQRRLLVLWMAAGILDFVVAIPLAAIMRVSDPASMFAMTMLPLCMISTFFVPVAVMGYFILGAHLWRQRKQI
jgi:hypothetical protein